MGGADLTLAGFISNKTPISLYVGPGLSKVEDLKGKTVAVTRLASSTAYMAKVCFGQYRLEPVKDIPLIQSGGYPESLAMLQAGRVQGAMLSPPFTYKAEALGFKRIWNGSGVEYPSFVLATRKTFIRDSADRAQKAFNAVAEGVHIFRTDKERAIRVMAKYTKVERPQRFLKIPTWITRMSTAQHAPDGERRKTYSRYSGSVQSEGRGGKAGTIFRRDPVTAFGRERRDEKILEGC